MFFTYPHYVSDPTHVIGMSSLKVSDEGALTKEPIYSRPSHLTTTTYNSRSGQGPVGQL
jgi:hypothetical protein